MSCQGCRQGRAHRTSRFCVGCSGAQTILRELEEPWSNSSLRSLGEDIAVSAARHIRALRIGSKSTGAPAPAAVKEEKQDKAEPLAEGTNQEEKSKRDRPPLPRVRKPFVRGPRDHPVFRKNRPATSARERSRSAPYRTRDLPARGVKTEEATESDGAERDYSYYSSSTVPEEKQADLPRDPPGVVPKARPEVRSPQGSGGAVKAKEDTAGDPLKLESKQEVEHKKLAAEIAAAPVVDIGSEGDKEKSKQQYLQHLRDREAAEERKQSSGSNALEKEGKVSEKSELGGNFLSLAGDYRSKEDSGKRRRRKR